MSDQEDQGKPQADTPAHPPAPGKPPPTQEPPPFKPDYSLITYIERSRKAVGKKRKGK